MRHSARKITHRSKRPTRRCEIAQDNPHDAIALEFLRLWMGLSRLRERLWDGADQMRPCNPPAPKASRRKAA